MPLNINDWLEEDEEDYSEGQDDDYTFMAGDLATSGHYQEGLGDYPESNAEGYT